MAQDMTTSSCGGKPPECSSSKASAAARILVIFSRKTTIASGNICSGRYADSDSMLTGKRLLGSMFERWKSLTKKVIANSAEFNTSVELFMAKDLATDGIPPYAVRVHTDGFCTRVNIYHSWGEARLKFLSKMGWYRIEAWVICMKKHSREQTVGRSG